MFKIQGETVKTASEELQEYLVSLDDDDFVEFCRKIDHRMTVRVGDGVRQQWSTDGSIDDLLHHCDFYLPDERDRIIDTILQTKHTKPEKFEKTLRMAGIRADDARDLALSEQANRIARQAKTIAILALLASLLIPAGQWLVDSLGQKTRPPQTTSQPTSARGTF